MQAQTARLEAIDAIRKRVQDVVSASISDADAIGVALATAMARDASDVLGVLLSLSHANDAYVHQSKLKMTDPEFEVLFGSACIVTKPKSLEPTLDEPDFKKHESTINSALRCSLEEQAARKAWSKAITRLACYYALHTDNTEEKIGVCLGGLVRADSRRIDDARSSVEDEGANTLLLCKAVIALGRAVV